MTVTLTSQVLGLAVGAAYTGNLENWLLNEGYARADADSLTDPITVTPTAAVLTAADDAVNQTTSGDVIFGTKGGVRTTVALAAADTPAQAATKIDTALTGLANAAIVSGNLEVTSVATGPTAYVTVVGGAAAVLDDLGVTVGAIAYGGDGRPAGASNTGAQSASEVGDPSVAENREAPYFPGTPDRNATIANDADNLNETEFPNTEFDFDNAGTDTEAPSDVVLEPNEGSTTGGTVVVITGNNLEGVTAVTFDTVAGTDLDTSNAGDGVIVVTTPAGAAGPADVVLDDGSTDTTLAGGFTYVA